MTQTILSCQNLSKTYKQGDLEVEVLKGINLELVKGQQLAIMGSSGSGKSTLLHLLGGLDTPTEGGVMVADQDIFTLSETKRCELRNKHLGFIYQFHHLLPEFSALENVAMPLLIRGVSRDESRSLARDVLEKVGLGHRLEHKPSELSGGERQRAAIARALVTKPSCVLADEPTGNLDKSTADEVCELLLGLNKDLGICLVIVSHDKSVADRMQQTRYMVDGVLND